MIVRNRAAFYLGRRFPCVIGRGGLVADKREGDGGTPTGPLRLAALRWRADRGTRPAGQLPAKPIGPHDLWSDDPADPRYNHEIRDARGYSHERMRRRDRLYDLVAITDHNWPDANPGRGSAIFVHCWRAPGRPTEGCVAFDPLHLRWILAHWRPWGRIIVRP
ncbi:L,D-transpeptidase catalytic domain [Albimonas donghaensis]|uniref:L,D-transpeptidase catalytic domain n=1 Tax=Albimonas donghaensis TaxID=356660 RepID=A0A1H2Z362_9RHOB|nr:L,D-transpeptidase family protein [Albimonas donghaensis]SDX11893.1 L,D-transpeptidase catalytic domain [Albimonas donghaensis]